jgi:ferredoxin
MTDRIGMECDNCGVCIDACPTRALSFHVARAAGQVRPERGAASGGLVLALAPATRCARPEIVAVAVGLLLAAPAGAHHILGIPHYAYDDSYPQAPVLRLVEDVGPWEVQLTCYPGKPQPGARSEVHVYAVEKMRHRRPFPHPMALTVFAIDMWGGRTAIHGPATGARQQNLYKFFPTYPAAGNYEILLEMHDPQTHSTMRFPMAVGEPGNPWIPVGAFAGSLGSLWIVVRAIRIKRARRRGKVAR